MVEIDEQLCKGCEICADFCPKGVFTTSSSVSKRGYHLPAAVKKDKCTACRMCELLCPELAILVTKE